MRRLSTHTFARRSVQAEFAFSAPVRRIICPCCESWAEFQRVFRRRRTPCPWCAGTGTPLMPFYRPTYAQD